MNSCIFDGCAVSIIDAFFETARNNPDAFAIVTSQNGNKVKFYGLGTQKIDTLNFTVYPNPYYNGRNKEE